MQWHEQVGRWGYSAVMCQNDVPAQREMDGDVLLVGVENQAVWLWGVRGEGDNPWVIERENDEGRMWTDTGERLNEFLWHFTVVDAVLESRDGCSAADLSQQQLARLTTDWSAVAAKRWRWPAPEQTLWTHHGLLAWTMANEPPDTPVTPDTVYSVFVAAQSAEDLRTLNDSDISWDWDTRSA